VSLKQRNACSPSRLFPPEAKAAWEKGHGRLERRRVARVAVSPEEIGLTGGWQVIAVRRETIDLSKLKAEATEKATAATTEKVPEKARVEVGYYITSLSLEEHTDEEILAFIRGHWSAIENGTHYRRDVTLGEDACRVADRNAAAALASLRNLTNGLYELERERERTRVDTLKSWCQQQTFTSAWPLLQR